MSRPPVLLARSPLRILRLALAVCAASALHADDIRHVVIDDAWSGAAGAFFSGRLTETHASPSANHGRLKSVYHNSRLMLTSGEEGEVTWRAGGLEWTTRTDSEGYWRLSTNQPLPLAPGWHEMTATPAAAGPAGLLVADPSARFGIISDIDDTILVSEVLAKRTLLKNSLATPPERREAVAGMAALYRRLLAQNPEPSSAPLFYVSASPRQLTGNLRGFLAANDFPRGVLHLKELSDASPDSLVGGDRRAYKLRVIEAVLRSFPQTRFALFGDDGEQDPEIYDEIGRRFPDRVESVWIRRVDPSPARARFPGQGDTAALLAAPSQTDGAAR